jgi:hypothetical protein
MPVPPPRAVAAPLRVLAPCGIATPTPLPPPPSIASHTGRATYASVARLSPHPVPCATMQNISGVGLQARHAPQTPSRPPCSAVPCARMQSSRGVTLQAGHSAQPCSSPRVRVVPATPLPHGCAPHINAHNAIHTVLAQSTGIAQGLKQLLVVGQHNDDVCTMLFADSLTWQRGKRHCSVTLDRARTNALTQLRSGLLKLKVSYEGAPVTLLRVCHEHVQHVVDNKEAYDIMVPLLLMGMQDDGHTASATYGMPTPQPSHATITASPVAHKRARASTTGHCVAPSALHSTSATPLPPNKRTRRQPSKLQCVCGGLITLADALRGVACFTGPSL